MEIDNLNFEQGTLNFVVPKGKIKYDDDNTTTIFSFRNAIGSLIIIKNKDNGIEINYNYFDKAICCLKTDASILDNDDEHTFAVTWSLDEKEIILLIDNKEEATAELEILSS